jgi:hypothetical protein
MPGTEEVPVPEKSEVEEVFGVEVVAAAMLARLVRQTCAVTNRGESYRIKEKRRSGLLKPPELTTPR